MYIEPNTVIHLCKDVPLDTTYSHTIYFDSARNQLSFFLNKRKYTLNNQAYQRVNKGIMRVQYKAEDLYDCNYLIFQNTSFGDKWFFAFIRSVEYVNNITSEITFELDIMQTWYFDYTLQECFVDREHASSDGVGANTVPENLELGDYVVGESGVYDVYDGNPYICFVTTFNNDDDLSDKTDGSTVNDIYSALAYHFFPLLPSPDDADAFLDKIVEKNKWDGVISVFMSPFPADTVYNLWNISKPTDLNGYSPRNNKLLSWPFNLLHMYTDVSSGDFKYELFNDNNCRFSVNGCMTPNPSMMLTPANYAQGSQEYRLAITDFPQCAISGDVYKIYLAQNAASLPTRTIGGAVKAGIGIVGSVLNPLAGALGLAGQAVDYAADVANTLAQVYDISTKPPQVNGTQFSSSDWVFGNKKFRYMQLCIKPEFARIIDDYFDMYGYATHRTKVPNRKVRENWTYTKTKGCTITGSLPCDDMARICSIYDHGITFWANGDSIGNYSLSNNPI